MQRSKYRTGPNPPVSVGQLWMDEKTEKVRRVTGFDEWEVRFKSVVTGVSTTVQRVSRNGSPSRYRFIEPLLEEVPPVHIRRSVDNHQGQRETFCSQLVENVVVSCSAGDVGFWKKRGREICSACESRSQDPIEQTLQQVHAA